MPADKSDVRWKHIELGLAAQRFLDTELAKTMIFDAETERAEVVEALAALDSDDHDFRAQYRRKQDRIRQLDCWQEFIAHYIQRGEAAEDALAAEDTPTGSDEQNPPEGE